MAGLLEREIIMPLANRIIILLQSRVGGFAKFQSALAGVMHVNRIVMDT